MLYLLIWAVTVTGDTTVTQQDVLGMLSLVPSCETCEFSNKGGWDKRPRSAELAEAIAEAADGRLTGSPHQDAALMAVFAVFESGLKACAVGDGGKSIGYYQLQRVGQAVACDARRATAEFIVRILLSMQVCSNLDPNDRLAAYASGSCDRGRTVSRRRLQVARQISDTLN